MIDELSITILQKGEKKNLIQMRTDQTNQSQAQLPCLESAVALWLLSQKQTKQIHTQ